MPTKKFSWVNTHKEITEYLKSKKDSQLELIQLLKSVGIGPFNDKTAIDADHDIELEEIDPFTFYCYIYKYSAQRLQKLQKIAEKLNVPIPDDDSGIPSTQPQRVWLFPYKFARTNNEISRLWNFFNKALTKTITNEEFEDVLQIRNVGKTKLTEALFYIDPITYFPINRPTKLFLKEKLGIDPRFSSYDEYSAILVKIRETTKQSFYEISSEAWYWLDSQKTAQKKEDKKSMNYWIFQGNPKVYDFMNALEEDILDSWTVSAHKDEINAGDKVILWLTGEEAGCYALAEVTAPPHKQSKNTDNHLWEEKSSNETKANIEITHNLLDTPILWNEVKDVSPLMDLKVGPQGTNFTATKEQYEAFLSIIEPEGEPLYWLFSPGENANKWDEFYEEKIMGLGWENVGDLRQYKDKTEIRNALIDAYGGSGSKKNDSTANDEFANKMKIGDYIISKKGQKELLGYGIVQSEYLYDDFRQEFKSYRKVDWKLKGNWVVNWNLATKTLTDITRYPTDDPQYTRYYEKLMGAMGVKLNKTGFRGNEDPVINFPLNTILYGPPGTGKTYNTIKRAAEILEGRPISDYDEALRIYKSNLHDRVEFITFHQNYSYEDFIQGLRPDVENTGSLSFERKDGIFKKIADRALKNIKNSNSSQILKAPFDVVFEEYISPLMEGEVEEIEVKMKRVSYFITGLTTSNSLEFRKASGGTTHNLSIKRIKRMYEDESDREILGLSIYYKPLVNELLKIGKKRARASENSILQTYVFIIDEINRANISRVFGELITLIEPDKRYGGNLAMEVKLPGGDLFTVPSNLYIIGTMNTADKSIALMDIALRRRFEFEPMYPKYHIEGYEIYDSNILQKINEKIIETKGYDFQIGHSYFMGKDYDLVSRINNKVIPLLLEYYMNDEQMVSEILGTADLKIHRDSWPLKIEGKSD